MSRALRLAGLCSLIGTAASAQQVQGTWTGYVNGWVPDARPTAPRYVDRTTIRLTEQQRQAWIYNQLVAQQAFFAQQAIAAQSKEAERQRESEARAAELRLYEQQQALIQQQQAAQAQLLAEQQLLAAEREKLRLEEERKALEAARARLVEEQERAAKNALAAQEEAKKVTAVAAPPRDDTPGPPIHKWVDEEGVTHFSTRPRR
jgi:hypothetical protein